MKICDNTSVGIIITDPDGKYLMFDRATFPPGTAPAAGHIDDHGTAEDAARAEVGEELGLNVVSLELAVEGWRHNNCRRQRGPRGIGHQWMIFKATVTGHLVPSVRETKNVRWISPADVQALAARTRAYATGHISDDEFMDQPGIEPVWVQWLDAVGAIEMSAIDLASIDRVAASSSPS